MTRTLQISLLVCLCLLTLSPAWCQVRSSTITGAVTDASGAVVPEASVTIVNQDTNVTSEAKSSSAGEFTVPYLPTGKYSVLVQKEGFQPQRQTDIVLGSEQSVRVSVSLVLSKLQSVLEVKANVMQLQTENSTVQGAVDSSIIAAIPNMTQNPLVYAALQAGITPHDSMLNTSSPDSFGIGLQSRFNFSAFSINGSPAFTNDIQLDGLSVQGSAWNEASVLPNPDSIEEVRVNSNSFAADLGRGQGVVSIITKGGTNSFHGNVNYQTRNEALNANTFSNNALDIPRGPFKVHQFGGSVGGPVIKDKLFFFTSYEHLIHSDPAQWLLTVPTALERQGNFSQTMISDQNGNPIHSVIYDPFNVTQLSSNLYQRALVPNNTIANPNPYSLKIYGAYPLPNRTPTDAFGSNNYYVQKTRTFDRNSSNSRVDYHHGNQSFYGTGGLEQGAIDTPRPFGSGSPFYISPTNTFSAEHNGDKNPYGAFGDTIVLSPTLVVDLRYGINRINTERIGGQNSTFDYSAYGVPPAIQAIIPYPGVALDLGALGYSDLSNTIYMQKREHQTNHTLAGSATKNLSKWTIKAGTEYRVYLSNYTDFESGSAMLNNNVTRVYNSEYSDTEGNGVALNATPQQQGLNKAALMQGVNGYYVSKGFGVRPAFAQKLFALYSQNDWHVTSKLVLNFGLRWELQPGPTERFNRVSSIDLKAANPYYGQGAVAFAGTKGYSRNMWNTNWADIQPRVGFAYRLREDLVLRGGYGRSYLPSNTGFYDGPYEYGTNTFAPYTGINPYGTNPNGVPVGQFSDGTTTIIYPATNAQQVAQVYGLSKPMFNKNDYKDGNTDQWNFFIEKRFKEWLVSVGYIGMRAQDLDVARLPVQGIQNMSDATLQSWKQSYIASNGQNNPAWDYVPNPYQTGSSLLPFTGYLANSVIQRYQTMLPYPMLTDSASEQWTHGFSNYNALQVRVNHAFASGFQLQSSYTWSKATEFNFTELQGSQGFSDTTCGGCGYDLRNLNNNKALAVTDIPHRFLVVATYALPFGKGKSLEIQNAVLRQVVGNWQLGGVFTLQSGLPLGLNGCGALNGRCNVVPGQSQEVPKALQRWYNGSTSVALPDGRVITPCANCFLKYNPDYLSGTVDQLPNGKYVGDPFWYGTAARDYGEIRGPRRNNIDLSINRQFKIKERFSLEFVANITNLLNHTQFMSSGYNTGGGTVTVADPATNLTPGMNSNSNFGTHGLATYDPRQVSFNLRIVF